MSRSITGMIITLNEAHNIRECVKSLRQVCAEIIVVDSGSSDNTQEIATDLGAKVYQQAYLGDGPQKNHGLQFASNKWVLSIDADERLSSKMVEVIQKLDLESTSFDAFAFARKNYVGTHWVKSCGWYPDYCIRLYNKSITRFSEAQGHSSVQTQNYKSLDGDIIHYSFKHIGELFAKTSRFSSRGAKILFKKGRRANAFSPIGHGIVAFIRKYIFQRGCFEGIYGLSISLSTFINSYLKYARLLEIQKDSEQQKELDQGNFW